MRRPGSADEIIEQLRELVATNAAGNARLAGRLSDFVREVSRELGRGQRVDATELFSRWVDFNLQSYALLNKQSLALFDGLLSVARETLLTGSEAPQPAPQEPRVELRLSGRAGERVTTGFVIENHFDQPLDVAFECDDLTAPSGQTQPAGLVDFNPPKLTIAPRDHAIGNVGVSLTSEFVVGETYRTTIRLLGFPNKQLGLQLTVLPPAEQPALTRRAKSAAPGAASVSAKRAPRSRGQSGP